MESTITDRLIGIEIEIVVPIIGRGDNADVQNLLAEVLTNQGLSSVSRGYCRQPIPNGCKLAVEHDASLRDESKYQGLRWSKIEVKTAPMAWSEMERVLPPALEIIRYFGARVNGSCGLHVHHHFPEAVDRPQVVRNLQHLWWRFHPVIYGLLPPSRKFNTYCHPPQQTDAKQYDSCHSYSKLVGILSRATRFDGLNLTNLANRDRFTVEWRIHGGTTDFDKIRAWVLATQRWVEHACNRNCHYRPKPMANTREGINALLVTTGLKTNSRIYEKVSKDLRQVGRFLRRRWKHFSQHHEFAAKPVAAVPAGPPF